MNHSIQEEDPDNGGHSPQHEHRETGGGEMGRQQPQTATQSNGQMMVQHKQQSSPTSHSRQTPTDDRPRPSLDPTGMFRNRGRRVVAGSRSSPVRTSPSPVNGQEKTERMSYRMRYDASTSAETNKIAEAVQPSLPQSRIDNDDVGEPQANEGDNCHDEGETQHDDCRKINDEERNAKQLDCSGITANRSRDSNDNEHASDIGSTVSVLGSIVGEGEAASEIDEALLLAVKQRMVDDVAEVADEVGSAGSGVGTTTHHENGALNDTLASQADDAGDDVLNVSMEVNADTTDTSLLEDHPVNDAAIENERDGGRCRDTAAAGDDVDANNKNTINRVDGAGHEPMEEQESPLRAAFRRSAQGLSRNLPPLSAQMLVAAPYRATATSAIDKAATTASMFPQFARQCFSFEDTTVDDDAFLLMPGQPHLGGEAGQYYGLSGPAWDDAPAEGISGSDGKASTPASGDLFRSTAPNWYPPHRTRLSNGEPGSPFRVIRPSKTWDHNGVVNPSSGGIRQTASFDPWSPPSIGRESWGSWKNPADATGAFGDRERLIGRIGKHDEHWKKLEVEREDAIDLLSCLVEQSLDFNPMDECLDAFFCDDCQQTLHKDQPFSGCDGCIEKLATSLKDVSAGSPERETKLDAIDSLMRSHEFALEVRRSCVSAKKWLQSIGSAQSCKSSDEQDGERNPKVDAAAIRAQLHSVEDATLSREEEIRRLNEELSKCRAEIGRLNSFQSSKLQPAQQPMLSMPANRSILSSSASSDGGEGGELVLRSPDAKLCESHDKSFLQWEKKIEAELQLESRKEILLLRAALERANQKISAFEHQGKEPFSSEIEPIEAAKEESDLLMKIADEIEATVASASTDDDEENSNNDDDIAPSVKLDDPALEKELDEYRTALIASLRAEEDERSMHAESTAEEPNAGNHLSESHSSEQMVNIRMLDGENFSTEWGQMALPPLPDHGLGAPIVDTILSAWTDDSDTKTALKGWVEDILSGAKTVDSMPCLKLSGLDHQVRDGFVMHVLPLLLSRNDLHVEITSRAHRQTTYDIAVSVRQTVAARERAGVTDTTGSQTSNLHQRQTSGEIQHHLMAYQATQNGAAIKERDESHDMSPKKPLLASSFPVLIRNSSNASVNRAPSNAGSIFSAVTSPISNSRRGPLIGRSMYTSLSSELKGDNSFTANHASPSLMDDVSVASSADDDDVEDAGTKSFGMVRSLGMGFLSRRKPSPTQHDSDGAAVNQTPERESRTGEEWSRSGKIHRVVTAPPGKLGITFVEYRGHAVVSRVSPESPLAGWVFPTDELIAIDDVSVSGLRTKEVVKVLTDKGAERRNLTMVSSEVSP